LSKRERLEDLGVILEKVHQLTQHEVFDLYHGRKKDIHGWWASINEDLKEEFLHKIAYGLADVSEKIVEIWEIALGEKDRV
jgi:hypothetical protein